MTTYEPFKLVKITITCIKCQQLILWRSSDNAFSPKCSLSLECQRVSNTDYRKRKKWKGQWIRDLGFRGGVNEIFILLDVTQRLLVVSYRRFETIYRPHLQRPRKSWNIYPCVCPETSARKYYCTLRNIPEGYSFRLLRGRNLNSRHFGPILRPTQPPTEWVSGTLSPGIKWPKPEATSHFHIEQWRQCLGLYVISSPAVIACVRTIFPFGLFSYILRQLNSSASIVTWLPAGQL